jgi:hypothetical protein
MSVLSDPEREQALARILRAAKAVCEADDATDLYWAMEALGGALADLPLAERLRYGL